MTADFDPGPILGSHRLPRLRKRRHWDVLIAAPIRKVNRILAQQGEKAWKVIFGLQGDLSAIFGDLQAKEEFPIVGQSCSLAACRGA